MSDTHLEVVEYLILHETIGTIGRVVRQPGKKWGWYLYGSNLGSSAMIGNFDSPETAAKDARESFDRREQARDSYKAFKKRIRDSRNKYDIPT